MRPYQARAVQAVKRAWIEGARAILLVSPTGSGKTSCGVGIVEGAVAKGRRVLWLAHRRELIAQASERLDRVGCTHHGVVLAGHQRNNPLFPIQVASVQTLTARGNAPPADILVIDEAHHATAATYRDIARAYPGATIIGLTATPERADRSPLGDVFDSMVVAIQVRELVGEGHLVPVHTIAPAKFLDALAEDPVAAYLRLVPGKRALVFAASIAHARDLTGRFRMAGIPSECVEGTTKTTEREGALERLARGETLVLVNVFCLTEGTDVPAIESVIIARGCSAWSAWVQMGGRGLRPSPSTGKTTCTLIDLRGHVHVHGMLDDPREFSLEGKASQAATGLVPLRMCRGCGATFRTAPVCPRCGAAQPPPDPPKVKRAAIAPVTQAVVASHAVKRAFFDQLVNEARERGYKPKYVGVRFQQRFGHWPFWSMPKGDAAHA